MAAKDLYATGWQAFRRVVLRNRREPDRDPCASHARSERLETASKARAHAAQPISSDGWSHAEGRAPYDAALELMRLEPEPRFMYSGSIRSPKNVAHDDTSHGDDGSHNQPSGSLDGTSVHSRHEPPPHSATVRLVVGEPLDQHRFLVPGLCFEESCQERACEQRERR